MYSQFMMHGQKNIKSFPHLLKVVKVVVILQFPYQNPVSISLLPHVCHIPRPFDHRNNLRSVVQIINLLII